MATTNIFDLLTDDAPDQEIRIPVAKKDATPAKPKPKPASTTTAGSASRQSDSAKGPRRDAPRPNRPRDTDAPRGPQYDRSTRSEGDPAPRAPRGSRKLPHRGGRHGGYDRHSATGIADSEKKEKQGWGEPTTSELEGAKDAELAEEGGTRAGTPEPAEPEPAVKTLDDYLQEKANRALKVSLPNVREANAGADDSKWKGSKVLQIEETEDFIFMGKETVAKVRKSKKETKVLITDIEVRYTEPARDSSPRTAFRGGRGGRGGRDSSRGGGVRGGRGGHGGHGGHGGQGGHRGGHASRGGAHVNVDDTELFPSLGSH
ncbi:hypothetical protein BGW38_006755 [Lunasporangiospora selenospora]|uniref:Hyaluronan/mRNA-binding protein domain-containing protein n=1 Tax=Lunasporangiospora selenospora TaxID=979761 RepID=A0A9P6FM72_9FUNG|nr:hypothetical protein BGW38_006755 [Lunasporangiospora selenospora]